MLVSWRRITVVRKSWRKVIFLRRLHKLLLQMWLGWGIIIGEFWRQVFFRWGIHVTTGLSPLSWWQILYGRGPHVVVLGLLVIVSFFWCGYAFVL